MQLLLSPKSPALKKRPRALRLAAVRSSWNSYRRPLSRILLLSAVLLTPLLFWIRSSLRARSNARAVEELLATPPGPVDLAMAALRLAKERFPDLNMDVAERKFVWLTYKVEEAAKKLKEQGVERFETDALTAVLFEEERIKYDVERLKTNDPRPGFLSYLLWTRQGDCLSMTTLCLVIAQRLGWPIFPVSAPGHIYLSYRYPDGTYYNFEPTSGGEALSDESYTQNLAITAKGNETGAYLRPLKDREFLARLINHSSAGLHPDKAIPRLKAAIEMDPTCANCFMQLSDLYQMKSVMSEGEESLRYDEESRRCWEKGKELGWVALEDTPLWKRRMAE